MGVGVWAGSRVQQGATGCQEVCDSDPFIGNPAGLWEQLECGFGLL